VYLQLWTGSRWETIDKNFAKKNNCMAKYPWTVYASYSESYGTYKYRLYFPRQAGMSTTYEYFTVTVS
jgi:hypothetical protein